MSDSSTKAIKVVLCPVSDVETAKALYAALLGMAPTADSEYYVGFDLDGQYVGLPGGGPEGLTSPTPFWEVEDIDAKLAVPEAFRSSS
jgi:catechol 2,3-dioxygenase-like lactoylglutathione lyase family enzyme